MKKKKQRRKGKTHLVKHTRKSQGNVSSRYDNAINPFRTPKHLPLLNPSNFVPQNGLPVVKELTEVHATPRRKKKKKNVEEEKHISSNTQANPRDTSVVDATRLLTEVHATPRNTKTLVHVVHYRQPSRNTDSGFAKACKKKPKGERKDASIVTYGWAKLANPTYTPIVQTMAGFTRSAHYARTCDKDT